MKFTNKERLSVTMANFKTVMNGTNLALLFQVINDDSCNFKSVSFDAFVEKLMTTQQGNKVKAFAVTNPVSNQIISFYTDGLTVMPYDVEAFDKFVCNIAGFNDAGELHVLNLMAFPTTMKL